MCQELVEGEKCQKNVGVLSEGADRVSVSIFAVSRRIRRASRESGCLCGSAYKRSDEANL